MEVTERASARATEAQRLAADPGHSAWVSASAGTGKTKVLTDRVLRLLLGNCRRPSILCLTFTKAAAAEMSTRLAERARRTGPPLEDELRARARELTGGRPGSAVPCARRLFARVLDTPGGMRIQTIHAFCQSLLRASRWRPASRRISRDGGARRRRAAGRGARRGADARAPAGDRRARRRSTEVARAGAGSTT